MILLSLPAASIKAWPDTNRDSLALRSSQCRAPKISCKFQHVVTGLPANETR
jgi:hypothetical protein